MLWSILYGKIFFVVENLIFADDCSLLASGLGLDPTETVEIIIRDLLRISNWANKWKINFPSNFSSRKIDFPLFPSKNHFLTKN